MKQYIILFSALILVVALHLFQNNYLEKTSKYFLTDIGDTTQALLREDFEEAKKSASEVEYTWKSIKDGWDSLGDHDDVGQISLYIANLNLYTSQHEKSDALSEAENIKHTINHIIQSEKLRLGNIL